MRRHLRIELLPAGFGDALWIEYGTNRQLHRILIDGGLSPTYENLYTRLERLPKSERNLVLVVCTHVDMDHISGLLSLFRNPPSELNIRDVWFNAWNQIKDFDQTLGPVQGEELDYHLGSRAIPHNRDFLERAVYVKHQGNLPVKTLPGGMKITVLGPSEHRLTRLAATWRTELKKKKLVPGEVFPAIDEPDKRSRSIVDELLGSPDIHTLARLPFSEDTATANGSSIALLLEYGGKRLLCAGDAFPSDVLAGLKRWNTHPGASLASIDAIKISHHGGKPNTSPALLQYVNCPHYLLSTNGVSHEHPDPETIARILVHSPRKSHQSLKLHFNYRTKYNQDWDNPRMKTKHNYEALYPEKGTEGITLTLL